MKSMIEHRTLSAGGISWSKRAAKCSSSFSSKSEYVKLL
jgi:hypothetical protein